uniref:Potassium/proton antiporter CemA n=1 Tax=Chaetophora sp. FACHB-2423 TaxID=2725789 RepID=A0A6H1XE77_9CHLO|nr:chloroplast envelope membrane protein [Chaetophora sp. FACHB-2423]
MTELEKIGLIPRSIVRMLDRFYYQIYLGTAEPLVKQFRFSKYLLLTSVKSLFVVLFIPFFINIFTKIYVFRPLVEYFWDRKQTEIFLNYELQEKAFSEIRNFEEKMYFDYLIKTENFAEHPFLGPMTGHKQEFRDGSRIWPIIDTSDRTALTASHKARLTGNSGSAPLSGYSQLSVIRLEKNFRHNQFYFVSFPNSIDTPSILFNKNTESIFRQKTRELANHYNNESISAITNLLADFMGLLILLFLLVNMKMSLMNTTAFLSESFFSLKDSKKAFLMLLFTDLLVGFHSPRGWEVIFHFLFEHFGLPENHNIIFLLVGTFPVLLDALFKYWIFRHLNRHSPATVATFQAMVE